MCNVVDLKKLCQDVQEIARKCGENIIENYGSMDSKEYSYI